MLRNALRPGRYRAHPDACCAPNLHVKHRCRFHCADLHSNALLNLFFVSALCISRGAESRFSETRCVQVKTALILTRAVHPIPTWSNDPVLNITKENFISALNSSLLLQDIKNYRTPFFESDENFECSVLIYSKWNSAQCTTQLHALLNAASPESVMLSKGSCISFQVKLAILERLKYLKPQSKTRFCCLSGIPAASSAAFTSPWISPCTGQQYDKVQTSVSSQETILCSRYYVPMPDMV